MNYFDLSVSVRVCAHHRHESIYNHTLPWYIYLSKGSITFRTGTPHPQVVVHTINKYNMVHTKYKMVHTKYNMVHTKYSMVHTKYNMTVCFWWVLTRAGVEARAAEAVVAVFVLGALI